MKIHLFYPPIGNITEPYLSLPSLAAYLKKQGIKDVSQYDLNLETVYELLTPERIRRAYRWCYHYVNKSLKELNFSCENRMKMQFIKNSFLAGSSFMDDLPYAKSTFKGKNFYNQNEYRMSFNTLLLSYLMLSARYFPTIFSHQSFSMRYRCDTSLDILEAVKNEEENPFIEIFSQRIADIFDNDGIPDIVGISIGFFEQLIPGFTLAKVIKELAPHTHITVGGPLMSAYYGKKLNPSFFKFFDSIIQFEGEIPLLKLIESIKNGKGLESVPSLIFCRDGNITYTPISPSIKDINLLPTPDFDFSSRNDYFSPEPIFPLSTSRGCYWRKCAFCTRQHFIHTYRQRDPQIIIEDIVKLQKKYGVRNFFFVDECILPRILNDLADKILSHKIQIRWSCYVRFEEKFLDKDFCKKLSRSGLRILYFGLESACQRILDHMKKGTKKEVMKKIIENTSEAGIKNTILYFVGFPTESKKEAHETMEFVLENHKYITFAFAGHFILEEHSPVFKEPEKYGVTEVYPLSESADMGIIYKYKTNSGMSMQEAEQIKNYINRKTEHLHKMEFLNRSHLLLQS